MRPNFACGLTVVAVVACCPASHAAIINHDATITVITPPASVQNHAIVSDTEISLFAEKLGFILPQDLNFNITAPTTAPADASLGTTPGTVPAGTVVDSYYVHFQSVSGTVLDPVLISGSITFDHDVLGIAIFNQAIDDSDPILGVATTLYATGGGRSLEITPGGIVGDGPNDRITLSADRRTVFLDIGNTGGGDQLRIVTASIPEPSTWALMAIAAAGLGVGRLLRRRSPKQ